MSRPCILFVHNALQPFVAVDRDLLRERYAVQEWFVRGRLINVAATWRAVRRADLVFGWFASWHTLFPMLFARLLGKPSLVVVGGYDTANVPRAGYGSQRSMLKWRVVKLITHNASRLLAFSESARNEALQRAMAHPGKIIALYLGVPAREIPRVRRDPRLVITVGGVGQTNLLRKGLLPFVQAATYLPDLQFTLAGKWFDDSIETLRAAAGANVTFTGYLSDADLQALYARASVYVQASLHEGFGMSVAEAMLAGCIPVVTHVGSLPEVVGDCGFYAADNSPQAVAAAIQQASGAEEALRQRARERVLTHFSMEQRRQGLFEQVERLLQKRGTDHA
ncbi:MAG: glycosyltransferase [Chloroflexi bacterium CFX4]|nr:glycosyltransferase [Chloroflexi bacterium CFX4]MDL1923179.1 glycosyltransferase family 4 protein [Chloroflexi bacterium CFX3]